MLLKHFSWGYTMRDVMLAQAFPPLSLMMSCFTTYTDIFIWVFLWILKYHISMFKPALHIHGTMLLHEPLNVLRKACHSVSGKGTSCHNHFQHHSKSQVLYERKQTDAVHKNCISDRSPLFLLHLQVPKDTGKASLAERGDIFYERR